MVMRFSKEWLRSRIEKDKDIEGGAGLELSAESNFDQVAPQPVEGASISSNPNLLLGRLLRQLRRRDKMTLPALSDEARVSLDELRSIEDGRCYVIRPRTLHQLAAFYKVSPTALIALSPVIANRDPQLDRAAVRFAASSDDLSKLTKDERRSLNEFVEILSAYKGNASNGK